MKTLQLKSIPNKEVRAAARQLMDAGCTLSKTGKNHIAVRLEGRLVTVLPLTPSDWRGLRNSLRDARRRGVDL